MDKKEKDSALALARETFHREAEALLEIEKRLDDSFAKAVGTILDSKGKLIVTGVGKSGLVGRKIAATMASTGTPSYFVHPSDAFHGDLGMVSEGDVILALSYSGETDEILKLIPFFRRNSNIVISMTGSPASTLSRNADYNLDVSVESEACVLRLAPTTSTTAQMTMGDAIAIVLSKLKDFKMTDFARLHPGGSLGRRLLMNVASVMRSENLPIVAPETDTVEMIHQMSAGRLGLVVVCRGKTIEGIVTDGDVRRAMESRKEEFFNLRASDIATPNPKTISPDSKLAEAEKMLTDNKITSLLVTRSDGTLEGIVQIYDIKI